MLKEVFGNCRIVGLAGEKDSGKTNNLVAMIKDFRKNNKKTEIYVFGFEENVLRWMQEQFKGIYEISTLEHLRNKRNALIIIDEFELLQLNNRRYTERLNNFVDFIYHHNNWVILCSPSLREYNSIIGAKIERWAIKSIDINNLVNGSQLKDIILNYKGRYKAINSIDLEKGKLLIINQDYERVIDIEYIKEVDNKLKNVNIFDYKNV